VLPATNLGLRLRDRTDAVLLWRGDGVEIADRVSEILHDKTWADRLGTNARRFALENFDWARSAVQLEGFYCDLVDAMARPDQRARATISN
jgi:glycosyltransferase involved in cell wall biosynthesis